DVGAQLIVHLDISARVGGNAGLVEAKVVGVRPPADREQHVRSDDLSRLPVRLNPYGDGASLLLHTDDLAVYAHVDAFLAEEIGDGVRDVLVLACDQPRRKLDDRHLAAETTVRLRKFNADVASSQDDQMPRQKIDVHHRAVGQVGNLVETGNWRNR